MNKVITINLNGRGYQLEEAGYDLLRTYLDQATAKLQDNPDKEEIMGDFEQAIADKFEAHLGGHKNVVSTSEVEGVIAKMGPVNPGTSEHAGHTEASGAGAATSATGTTPKRLYQIREGSWISGVCTGIAAYFNVDVTVVRAIFVTLLIITHGAWAAVYVILLAVLPVARTDDEKARAHGTAPFNANDFIEQAKMRYAEFKKNHPEAPKQPADDADRATWHKWKHDMKMWKTQLKHDMKREKIARKHNREDWADRYKESMQYAWHNSPVVAAGSGFLRFLMGVIIAALTILAILATISIAGHKMIFGVMIGVGHPLWMSIVFVWALFYVVSTPFRLFMQNARPWSWGRYSFFNDLMQSIVFIFCLYLLVIFGGQLFPIVHEATGMVIQNIKTFVH